MTLVPRKITPAHLEQNGVPTVSEVAQGVIAIVSGDGLDTVDITHTQVAPLIERLERFLGGRGGHPSE